MVVKKLWGSKNGIISFGLMKINCLIVVEERKFVCPGKNVVVELFWTKIKDVNPKWSEVLHKAIEKSTR